MKPKTIRAKALGVLVTRLGTMDVVNGHFVKPTVVVRGGLDIPDHPTYPAIYFFTGEETKVKSGDALLCSIPILVILLAESYADQQDVAEEMIGDIVDVMGGDFTVFGSDNLELSIELAAKSVSVVAGEVNNSIVYVEVEYELEYYHAHGDATKRCG